MGKKDGLKRKRESTEDVVVDPELQAEIAAVIASRAERDTSLAIDPEAVNKDKYAYNKDGLIKSLESLDTFVLPFEETLQLCDFDLVIQNENDDIEREMSFYNHTLLAVKLGCEKLDTLHIPSRRPNDFFCENVKSDAHMAKIKDRLLVEEKRIEAFELRKNREQNRKFNRQVSELKKQEKSSSKKAYNNEVSKIRDSTDKSDSEHRLKQIIDGNKGGNAQKSRKREGMDKKYGFGAKERMMAKMTDRKSLNDLSDFNPRGGKLVRREGGGARGSRPNKASSEVSFKHGRNKSATNANKGKTSNRPGKDARAKRRSEKSG